MSEMVYMLHRLFVGLFSGFILFGLSGCGGALNVPISQEKPNTQVVECIRFSIEIKDCLEKKIQKAKLDKNISYIDLLKSEKYDCSSNSNINNTCIFRYVEKWYASDHSSFKIETWTFEAIIKNENFYLSQIMYSNISENGKKFGPINFRTRKEQDTQTQKIYQTQRR